MESINSRNRQCPLCRTKFRNVPKPNIVLQEIISKMFEKDAEYQQKIKMIKDQTTFKQLLQAYKNTPRYRNVKQILMSILKQYISVDIHTILEDHFKEFNPMEIFMQLYDLYIGKKIYMTTSNHILLASKIQSYYLQCKDREEIYSVVIQFFSDIHHNNKDIMLKTSQLLHSELKPPLKSFFNLGMMQQIIKFLTTAKGAEILVPEKESESECDEEEEYVSSDVGSSETGETGETDSEEIETVSVEELDQLLDDFENDIPEPEDMERARDDI